MIATSEPQQPDGTRPASKRPRPLIDEMTARARLVRPIATPDGLTPGERVEWVLVGLALGVIVACFWPGVFP